MSIADTEALLSYVMRGFAHAERMLALSQAAAIARMLGAHQVASAIEQLNTTPPASRPTPRQPEVGNAEVTTSDAVASALKSSEP